MANKMMVNTYRPTTKVRRRHKKRGLHIRKKLGPRHHMRVN